jgi:hypothetical protein
MSEPVALYVASRDGRELLYMTCVGNNQFRLVVTSIEGHLRYGDTIEVGPPQADGAVPCRRIVRRSSLRTQCFVLSKRIMENPDMWNFAKQIAALEGATAKVLPEECLSYISLVSLIWTFRKN